jgi:hypothetical protein
MAQYNINPPDYPRDTGVGTILAVLLVVVLVAFLVWALAFGGFSAMTGAPASGTTSASPSVNVNTGGTGSAAPSSGSTTSSGSTAPSSNSTGSTAPSKP